MADAEPEQKAGTVRLPFGVDRGEQIVDRFFLPALAPKQLGAVVVQPENVGGRVKPAKLDELGDALLAQSLDIECAARHEMPQPLESLRRADQPTGAPNVDLAFLGDRFGLTFGTM